MQSCRTGGTAAKKSLGKNEGRIFTFVVIRRIEMRIKRFVPCAYAKVRKKTHRPAKTRRRQCPDHVDCIAFEMKILNLRRVRKNLLDHFARQSLQKQLPSRTPILL